MATNKRDLKAYSRFDGTGRIVPGSTVLRRNIPKVGNWKEVQAYECCNVDQVKILVDLAEFEYPVTVDFVLACDLTPDFYIYNNSNIYAEDITELVAGLNSSLSQYGKFSLSGADIYLQVNSATATFFANSGCMQIGAYIVVSI